MTDATRRRRVLSVAPIIVAGLLTAGAVAVQGQADPSPKPATNPGSAAPDASPDLPRYDVATIKPAQGSDMRIAFMFSPDGISLSGVPAQMMLREGFHVEDDHIIGAPPWVKTKRYDVQAKVAPEDAPKLDKLKFDERRSMLVPLLVERFNLKYHHEMRELPGYALVVAKGGSKMKVSDIQPPPPKPPDAQGNGKADGADPKPDGPGGDRPRGPRLMMRPGHLDSQGTNTEMLARVLSQQLGRTVTDKSGLTGNYDFTLDWTPDNAPPPMAGGPEGGPPKNESGSDAAGPSLFTAVQEQLGLKLESTKEMADVIVIDHIDPPTEN